MSINLVSEGAIEAHTPSEVASQVDIVFTNLPDSPDVELVALGEDGIIEGAHEDLIYIDNSTIKPATARSVGKKLAEKGVSMLDAPVSGGDVGALNGTLTIMVGGDEKTLYIKAMPVSGSDGQDDYPCRWPWRWVNCQGGEPDHGRCSDGCDG